jgi:hypothetical protein
MSCFHSTLPKRSARANEKQALSPFMSPEKFPECDADRANDILQVRFV